MSAGDKVTQAAVERNVLSDIEWIKKELAALRAAVIQVGSLDEVSQDLGSMTTFYFETKRDDGSISTIFSSENLFADYGVDTFYLILDTDGTTPVAWIDPTTGILTSSGDVISDSATSIVGELAIFSSTDGKHIESAHIDVNRLLQRGRSFYLDDAAGYTGGAQLLSGNFSSLTSGTVTVSMPTGGLSSAFVYASDALGVPFILGGFFFADLWLSASTTQTVDVAVKFEVGSLASPTSLQNTTTVNISLTATPTKFSFFTPTPSAYTDYQIALTDRLLVTVLAGSGTSGNLIISHGDETYPSFVTVPYFDNDIVAGADTNNWKNVFVFDDFLSNYQSSYGSSPYNIGDLGWGASPDTGFTASAIAAGLAPEHPGLLKINTLSQSSDVFGYLVLSSGWLMPNKFDLMQFVALSEDPSEADDGVVYGAVLCDEVSGFNTDRTAEGIYFSFIFGETNWQAVTRDDTTSTETDTGVAFDSSKWVLFEIKRTATDTFEFYINQTIVATHTTHITSNPVTPTIGLAAQTIGSYGIYIDYFGMQLAHITQRWD